MTTRTHDSAHNSLILPANTRDKTSRSAPESELLPRILARYETAQAEAARDLHNLVGQSLTSIGLGLEALRMTSSPAEMESIQAEVRLMVKEAAKDIRNLMRKFRPKMLDDLGPAVAIQQLLRDLNGLGYYCDFDCQWEAGTRFAEPLETTLYRVAEEALQNFLKHAQAKQVWVTLTYEPGRIGMEIRDNGRGFSTPTQQTPGLGLALAQQRVAIVQGTLEIVSKVGAGTKWVVSLPDCVRNV